MNVTELQKLCKNFLAAEEKLSAAPANILSYSVGQKKFAYFKTSQPEQWRFSFRTMPARFLELTDLEGVKPARYMQRFYWVTIVDVAQFNESYLQELVHWSYIKALDSLSARQRRLLTVQDYYLQHQRCLT